MQNGHVDPLDRTQGASFVITSEPMPRERPGQADPWLSGNSVHAEDLHNVKHRVRELSTTDENPSAPTLDQLFRRSGTPPRQTVVVWDPGRRWPGFSMHSLAAAGSGTLTEVRLRLEGQSDPIVSLQHTLFRPDTLDMGVLQVRAQPDSPLAMRLALSLLEQADRPLILAGSSVDAELVRQVRAQLPDNQWDGPPLLVVSPSEKPSRGQRLRRLNWPIGLRIRVLEMFRNNATDWSARLISQVTADGVGAARKSPPRAAFDTPPTSPEQSLNPSPAERPETALAQPSAERTRPTAVAAAAAARIADVAPSLNRSGSASTVMAAAPSPRPPNMNRCDQALALLQSVPGVCAGAVVNSLDGALVAQLGSDEIARCSAGTVVLLERAFESGRTNVQASAALGELAWTAGTRHHVALPVGPRPGLWILVVVDREFGDVGHARWQLAVARQHLA